jgi:hypothetical protein
MLQMLQMLQVLWCNIAVYMRQFWLALLASRVWLAPLIARTQPQRHMGWLHSLLNHSQQMLT